MNLGAPQRVGAPEDPIDIISTINKSSETMENWSEERIVKNNNRLLFLTVEYVDDNQCKDFSKVFSPYEQVSFSPRASSPLSDFEHRVSPLDPNMSSTARYSPTPVQLSSFQNSVVVLPPSPLIIPPDNNTKANISYIPNSNNIIHNVIPQPDNTIDFVNTSNEEGLVTNVSSELILMQGTNNDLDSSTGPLTLTGISGGEFSLTRDFLVMHDDQLNVVNSLRNRNTETIGDPVNDSSEQASINITNSIDLSQETMMRTDNILNENQEKMCVVNDDITNVQKYQKQTKKLNEDINACCEECDGTGIKSDGCTCENVQTIADEPVPSRARATLPVLYLAINKLSAINTINNGTTALYGVFAKRSIKRRTQFGPIEGILCDYNSGILENELPLIYETDDGKLLRVDISNENTSNWMRFVRPALNYEEQNLVICQQNDGIVFLTTREILPKEELKAGPSLQYAIRRNLTVFQADVVKEKKQSSENVVLSYSDCDNIFETPQKLDDYANNNHNDNFTDKNEKKLDKKYSTLETDKLLKVVDDQTLLYACPHCPKIFPRSYSLRRHILMHPNSKSSRYECQKCDEKFLHLYNRNRHMKIFHSDETREKENSRENTDEWKCISCNLIFGKAALLNIHKLVHEKDNKINIDKEKSCACPQCSIEFNTQYDLINHVSKHGKLKIIKFDSSKMNSSGSSYKCLMCYKRFATKVRLQQHYLVHGADDQKPLSCNICFKRFMNNSALSCHLKTHRQDKQIFECPMCRQLFCQVLLLKEHIETHKNEDNTFTCPDCKRTFTKYSVIRKHIKAHHYERKHKCQFCTKRFPTVDKLRMHLLRHSDHREFHCANCEKQFKRKDKLKEHMTRMHNSQKIKREQIIQNNGQIKKFIPKVNPTDYNRFVYKCHQCLVGFKRRGMLVNHLAKRHPDISPDSVPELNLPILRQTRDYYCQYCDKVYKSSSKRKAHIVKNHPGAALPPSNLRQREVDSQGSINSTFSQTVGSVTTIPQNCQWCHKQYASKAKLLQHQRKKHSTLMKPADKIPRPRNRSSQNLTSTNTDNNFIISEYLQTKSRSENLDNFTKSKSVKFVDITDHNIELSQQIVRIRDVR
ncbi:PR domain zinc finger protein 10-like [Chelonus insularis]|uniref:PR domain zinc finger protein 10-like n=1 Tax=Chelonus insularis TaxID=460826 RepID=UPI00158B9C34|nr:PR domain zinc finger protein 10-like [Chelonus insularis]XP_034940800.1 PR domain zinc finger protein 10-like [Chelonus insularis]XP_034940801.1 PR domain zinc finger protein 10-like [Chelonus insularis]XP_034940802.1 PR domain zinc finger protein 10-like [Chelonus insularis]